MTWGCGPCGFTCESQCPPHQMTIQPPPFCVTVPGPILSCSDDTLAVDCNAPCGYGCGGWGNYGGYRGWGGRGWGGCGYGFGGFGGCSGPYGFWGGWGRPGCGNWGW